MIELKDIRKWSLALPDTEEKMHFEKPSFRVNGRIYATYHPKDHRAMIILDEINQSVFCGIPNGGFSILPGTWGKQGCTLVELAIADRKTVVDALQKGYDFILSKQKKKAKKQNAIPTTVSKKNTGSSPQSHFYNSKFNGKLEITMRNGVKVLDTDNTNYSYGTVQQVWGKTLRKAKIQGEESVLLLGLGGGSVIDLLRNKFDHTGKITAVEIDPVIVEIADKEFGIRNTRQTKIICDDAFSFVAACKKKFDLILVDIFLDRIMPENATSFDFWDRMGSLLNQEGLIIFNVFHYSKKLSSFRKGMISRGWNVVIHEKVNGTNTMIFAHQKNTTKRSKVRGEVD
ncbi:MAG: fused MFS/spermidine synthase [Flavobacteriales bacterium]